MFIFLLSLSLFLMNFFGFTFNTTKDNNNDISIEDRIVNLVIIESAEELEKLQLYLVGVGGSVENGKHTSISCSFALDHPLNESQARGMIVKSSQLLLNNINKKEKLQQYLVHNPFKYNDIEFEIYIFNEDHSILYHPNLAIVALTHGIIEYITNDPDLKYKYKSTVKETYEEALKKLNTQ